MTSSAPSRPHPVTRFLRRAYQRWFTRLPCRLRRFDELFPADCEPAGGVFRLRPRFTGLLHQEAGQPFLVEPTRYLHGQGRNLASDDARFWTREPDRRLYALADAGVYGVHGAVYDPRSRAFIAETCESWDDAFTQEPAFSSPGFPPPKRLPGVTLLLGTLGGQTFYHFFVENLPKLRLLQPYLASCDRILLGRYGENWKRRWLSLWGIEDKVVFIDELSHFHCDQLIFTNRFVRHFEPGPWCVETLRHLPGLPTVPASANRDGPIYWLDRTGQHMRAVKWEQALVAAVPGLVPLRLDSLAPHEAARLLGGARALVGFHGAAFSNMVFCPPGTRIIEVFTELKEPWFARLAQSCGHDHAALVAPDDESIVPTVATQLRAELERAPSSAAQP